VGLELRGQRGLGDGQAVLFRSQVDGLLLRGGEFLAQTGTLRLEGGDHIGIGGGIEGPGE